MEDKEKKSKLKEALKAAGVAGAGAAVGAATSNPRETLYRLGELGSNNSPLGLYVEDKLYGDGKLYDKTFENPNIGIGINAAASGLGALAAYGILKGLSSHKHKKNMELVKAYAEAAKSGRA